MSFYNLVNMRESGESLTKGINNVGLPVPVFNYFNDS